MDPAIRATSVIWKYDRAEVIADGIIHAIGIALGIAGAAVLLMTASRAANGAEIAPATIYIVGLLSMLGLSAAYNLWPISPR
jgi:hemolysin III